MDDVTALYRELDPLRPLRGDENALYVDWQQQLDPGGRDAKSRLVKAFRRNASVERPITRLLTGHRGCGKTTELNRVRDALSSRAHERGVFVSMLFADEWLDLKDVQAGGSRAADRAPARGRPGRRRRGIRRAEAERVLRDAVGEGEEPQARLGVGRCRPTEVQLQARALPVRARRVPGDPARPADDGLRSRQPRAAARGAQAAGARRLRRHRPDRQRPRPDPAEGARRRGA